MHSGHLSANELAAYQRDGYLLIKQLFDRDEIEQLRESAKRDSELDAQAYGRSDGEGGSDQMSSIENLAGGPLNDILFGDEGVNILKGEGGSDILYGFESADYLFGGAGHVYMRSAWDDPNATWAFFGAGPFHAPLTKPR